MILTGDFKDKRLAAIAHEPLTVYPVAAADLLCLPACLACDSRDTDTIAQVYVGDLEAFTTAACRACGYVWRSVTPNEAWFAKCAAMLPAGGKPDEAQERARGVAYGRRLEFVGEYVKTKTALDVGAAWGAGVTALKECGYDVEAIEPDVGRGTMIFERLGVYTFIGPLEDTLRRRKYFGEYGLVMLCHVLEHCRDPKFVLANLHRLLLPDGVAYVEVPSFGIINWSDAFYLAHMSNFSHTGFARLLKHVGSGLQVIASRFFIHEGNRADIGLVLARRQGIEQGFSIGQGTADIRRLYINGLPRNFLRDESEPLKYRVPHFSHFNYGLRWNRYSARRAGEFIEFVED